MAAHELRTISARSTPGSFPDTRHTWIATFFLTAICGGGRSSGYLHGGALERRSTLARDASFAPRRTGERAMIAAKKAACGSVPSGSAPSLWHAAHAAATEK